MSQLTGIIGHTYLELVADLAFRVVDDGTAAVGGYPFDSQLLATFDTKVEDGSDGLLIAGGAHVDSGLLDRESLGL